MVNRFLKAKHWQIFLLMIGIPMIFQIILTVFTLADFHNSDSNNKALFQLYAHFPIIMMISFSIFFGWFWSMAIGLQKKVPIHVKMKVRKFKVFFWIPFIYINLISVFLFIGFFGMAQRGIFPNRFISNLVFFIIPMHLFSMFCMFYILYFTAKTIKTVELQRKVNFGDFIGEFFALWFYLIGIWFIQPKVNKLAFAKLETIEDIGKIDNIKE